MARSPRITIPTLPHHIVQRGNNRQAVFFDDDDYRLYLECLRQAKENCSCRIYAYALMTNHVHVLAEPTRERDPGAGKGVGSLFLTLRTADETASEPSRWGHCRAQDTSLRRATNAVYCPR